MSENRIPIASQNIFKSRGFLHNNTYMAESPSDSKLEKLIKKVDSLEKKIDYIFGGAILIKGKFIDPKSFL